MRKERACDHAFAPVERLPGVNRAVRGDLGPVAREAFRTGCEKAQPIARWAEDQWSGRIGRQIGRHILGRASGPRHARPMADLIARPVIEIVDVAAIGRQVSVLLAFEPLHQQAERAGRHIPRVELVDAGRVADGDAPRGHQRRDLSPEHVGRAEACVPGWCGRGMVSHVASRMPSIGPCHRESSSNENDARLYQQGARCNWVKPNRPDRINCVGRTF